MSNTFSELAAESLVKALGAQPEGGRHLLTSVHGEDVADAFRALLARSNRARTFHIGRVDAPAPELRVIDDGGGCIIVPYLVQEPPPPRLRENRGGQGYVGALRDHFSDAAAPGERLMLLTFDASPNETELTTMDQGVLATALEPSTLLALALRPPDDASQALRRTLSELEVLAPKRFAAGLDPDTLGRAAQAVAGLGVIGSTDDVGRQLHLLPWCLSDPRLFEHAGREFQDRLETAIVQRARLEAWARDPTSDFDAEVRKLFSEAAAEKVVGARSGLEIDWAAFTLDDLQAGAPPPPPPDEVPRFASTPVSVSDATSTKLLADGATVAAQIPGPGCSLSFHLTYPLTGDATIHLVGYEGEDAPFAPLVVAKLGATDANGTTTVVADLAELPQPRAGWSFMEAVLTKGKRIVKAPLGTIKIALSIGPADVPLVYEASGEVDLESQAYSGDEELTLIGERGGEQVFAEKVEAPDPEFGGLITLEHGITAPGVQAELEEESDGQMSTESPEHLAVDAWARGQLEPGSVRTSLRERPGGVIVADIGPVSMPVTGDTSGAGSRWDLERHAISNPLTTAFRIAASGDPYANEEVEHLELGELAGPFEEFLSARESFFAELQELPVPSVLGADLTKSTIVPAYIDAYERVLQAVPDGQPGQLGYDRLLLVDSFVSDTSGELLIAPTSPLTVALHLQLQTQVREWVSSEPAANYFQGDIGLVAPQYLVRYLRLQTTPSQWLESGYAPYSWRKYLPFSERTRQQRHPSLHRYIARRIERFLDVHPSYADERRTVRLAFINPGSGAHVRDALLALVAPYLKRKSGEALRRLPAFELQLLSDRDRGEGEQLVGAALDVFMGMTPEEGQPSDAAVEVMKRLTYTKGQAAEFLTDPKSFAHIAFVEDFFEPRPDLVEWEADAHPSSMYAGGLAPDIERLATIEPAATRFLSATWTGGDLSGHVERIAARTTEVSAAAAGVPVKRGIVRAADVLIPDSAIPQLYDRAVWVVHIDRHVGLELFAPQDAKSGAPYILDYTDQETPEPGVFDGITATRQIGPYRARVADVLGTAVDQHVSEEAAERLLRILNLISGRWGLEMLRTSDNVLRGRLATALAAQVLEQAEKLHTDPNVLTLVVALDELLRVTGAEGLPLKEGWVAKAGRTGGGSDDLLLLNVPLTPGRPKITGRIVEVKYRKDLGASPEDAAAQLKATHELLTELLAGASQPGRMFQGRHLAKLILRYAGRHVTYGVRSGHPVVATGTEPLSRIAAGDYDLDLDLPRVGKVLCGDYVSVEPTLSDPSLTPQVASAGGVEIGRIRIGQPVIAAMLGAGQLPGQPLHPSVSATEPDTNDLQEDTLSTETESGPSSDFAPGASPAGPDEPGSQHGGDDSRTVERDGREAEKGPVVRQAPADAGVASASDERASPTPTDDDRQLGGAQALPDGNEAAPAVAAQTDSFAVPEDELRELSGRLDDVLTSYKLPLQPVEVANAVCGANTVRFRVRMARGGTIAQVEARERDIMRELGIDKPIMIGQDAGFVTLDVPRTHPVTVTFPDLAPQLGADPRTRGELPVLFGVDLAGRPRIEDLAQLPHLLVAGSTNSGKSVFLSSVLGSLAMLPPSQLEIVLVDVKGLDFAPFGALPHLRQPPIGNAEQALVVLEELYATERGHRHEVLAGVGAQSILDYYTRLGGIDLKQIVVVIDEFSNLLGGDKSTGSQLEDTIQQYAEIMRSFGIYLVIATQRPSADIVTGRIKANLPARCAFRLPTHSDSMTILGRKGAEQLLGRGDMLFYRDGFIERLQAPLTSPQDVLHSARQE